MSKEKNTPGESRADRLMREEMAAERRDYEQSQLENQNTPAWWQAWQTWFVFGIVAIICIFMIMWL